VLADLVRGLGDTAGLIPYRDLAKVMVRQVRSIILDPERERCVRNVPVEASTKSVTSCYVPYMQMQLQTSFLID